MNNRKFISTISEFLNESHHSKKELINIAIDYFNNHKDSHDHLKLDFEIEHNYTTLKFKELYNYDDELAFCLEDVSGRKATWYISTIDIQALQDIVSKMIQ